MADDVWLPEAMTRFQCNQQGCCCSGWNIRMDVESVFHIVTSLPEDRGPALLDGARVIRDPSDGKVVALDLKRSGAGGACAFLEADLRCEVHRTLGHAALPKLCQSFPASAVRHDDRLQLAWDPICPEVLERIAESDAPYPIVAAPCGDGTPLAGRVVNPQALPPIEVGGGQLSPEELAALVARILAAFDQSPRAAIDVLGAINVAVTRAGDDGVSTVLLDPEEVVADFDDFFEACVAAHDGRTLARFLSAYRRFVFAVPLPPGPWLDPSDALEYDPAWRRALDPRAPWLQPLLRRYLSHRFFSAFERSPATGFVAFNFGSVNHTLATAFRFAVGLATWLGRPIDRDLMKVAIGASEYTYRSLDLPAVTMPWFRLEVDEAL